MPADSQEIDLDISSAAERLISQPLRHVNLLPALIRQLNGPSLQGSEGPRAVQALRVFFNDYYKSLGQNSNAAIDLSAASPEALHQQWILRQQSLFQQQLISLLQLKKQLQVQVAAVHAMMDSARWLQPGGLPRSPVSTLVIHLLTSENTAACLPHFLDRYMKYADVRYQCLRTAARTASNLNSTAPEIGVSRIQRGAKKAKLVSGLNERSPNAEASDAEVIMRLFDLLTALAKAGMLESSSEAGIAESVGLASAGSSAAADSWCPSHGGDVTVASADPPPTKKRKSTAHTQQKDVAEKWRDPSQAKKAFTQAWLAFLALQLPPHLLHQVLEVMHEAVLPNMTTPVLLADYLTRAVDQGGATGMLALHALFLLMSRHGLEYPAFFQRLYSLLTPAMFKAKQRVRFCELADRCLASGMVPAYTAASFIKRFARLSLTASPAGAQLCLAFVHNLLRRHPACLDLLDKPAAADADGPRSGQDPYLDTAKDPAKAHALDSSLWEVEVLRNHYCPQVAAMVSVLDKDLRDRKKTAELDIYPLAAASYHSIVAGLLSQRLRAAPVAFYAEPPTGLFSALAQSGHQGWQLLPQ